MSQFRNAIIIIVLLLPAQLLANNTQTGMGAVIGSTSGLFLPIAAGELFIEPSVSFRKNETDSTTISNIARSGRKSRTVTLGVGLFKNKLVAEKVFLYYGARIGLVKRKITETTAPTSILSASSSTISDDGFFISPTVGAQYYFVPQFSAGLDLALQFSKTDGKEALTAGGITVTANTKDTSSSTTATVIVRYLF